MEGLAAAREALGMLDLGRPATGLLLIALSGLAAVYLIWRQLIARQDARQAAQDKRSDDLMNEMRLDLDSARKELREVRRETAECREQHERCREELGEVRDKLAELQRVVGMRKQERRPAE